MKPIHPIYRLDESTFRVGAQRGITVELADEKQQAWTLVHLLDGTRTPSQIVVEMRARFPEISAADVQRSIVALDEEALLEDARDADDTDPSLERWTANLNYFRRFSRLGVSAAAMHERLRGSRVVLLGLGGAGSTILPILASTGVGEILGIDYDRVERSNLNRQYLYRESDVGSYKTEAAARVMAQINSDVRFCTVTARIDAADDLLPLLDGADLVICAIDEPPFLAQRRVNRACVQAGVTCLFGFSQVTRGRVFAVIPGRSGCFDCLHIHHSRKDPRFLNQFRGFQDANFPHQTMGFSPDMARLAGLIVIEAVRLLTGYAAPRSVANQLELDFEADTAYHLLDWPRFGADCPTCGTGDESDWPVFGAYPGSVSRAPWVPGQRAA
ncbi:MAG TPA: ThiF family adenylyltransferase [Solirubrobacteraceae bacterium]|jgi:molybdopterin/thiamine biosynthesis adenylyltransferase|nr:ThiF family adenylyltransferase [Solirubrobacteraceae bacterium]